MIREGANRVRGLEIPKPSDYQMSVLIIVCFFSLLWFCILSWRQGLLGPLVCVVETGRIFKSGWNNSCWSMMLVSMCVFLMKGYSFIKDFSFHSVVCIIYIFNPLRQKPAQFAASIFSQNGWIPVIVHGTVHRSLFLGGNSPLIMIIPIQNPQKCKLPNIIDTFIWKYANLRRDTIYFHFIFCSLYTRKRVIYHSVFSICRVWLYLFDHEVSAQIYGNSFI